MTNISLYVNKGVCKVHLKDIIIHDSFMYTSTKRMKHCIPSSLSVAEGVPEFQHGRFGVAIKLGGNYRLTYGYRDGLGVCVY